MKITKFGHCCLLIEHKGKRILTDPGAWSTAQNDVKNIDLVLITHEHPDHFHIESLRQVIENNPGAKIITNTSVGKILAQENIAFDVVENRGDVRLDDILIEAFEGKHEEIYEDMGRVQNVGYFIDNTFFYPGDAFTDPGKPVEILAFPVVAPWATFKDCVEYALTVRPKVAIPVHDGYIIPDRTGPIYRLMPDLLEGKGVRFIPLREGDEWDREDSM